MIQLSGPGATRSAAANDYEVLDLATLKTLLVSASGGANDTVLQKLLDGVHQAAFKYTGRIFKLNATAYVQLYHGPGGTTLRLHQWPVATFTSLEAGYLTDSTGAFSILRTYASAEFYADKDRGIVMAMNGANFPSGWHNLRVTYTAGFAAAQMPADIQRAIADWVGVCLKRSIKQSWDVASEAVHEEVQTFILDEMPKSTKAVMDRYCRMEALIG